MTETTETNNNQNLDNSSYSENADSNQVPSSDKNKSILEKLSGKSLQIFTVLFLLFLLGIFGINQYNKVARTAELKRATMAFATRDAKQIIEDMMVKCPAGSFIMGSSPSELGRREDETQHKVTFTHDFYISKYPITQLIYKAIAGENPSQFKEDNAPVEHVSWYKAKEFCEKLNALTVNTIPSGYEFDLPTESQWEYACRAGTTSSLNSGKEISDVHNSCYNVSEVAWYQDNTDRPQTVGLKVPNAWGIYDMHGNVWEWCRDFYGPYPTGEVIDPEGPETGYTVVDRGGSWCNYFPRIFRSANRYHRKAEYEYNFLGFRIVLNAKKK